MRTDRRTADLPGRPGVRSDRARFEGPAVVRLAVAAPAFLGGRASRRCRRPPCYARKVRTHTDSRCCRPLEVIGPAQSVTPAPEGIMTGRDLVAGGANWTARFPWLASTAHRQRRLSPSPRSAHPTIVAALLLSVRHDGRAGHAAGCCFRLNPTLGRPALHAFSVDRDPEARSMTRSTTVRDGRRATSSGRPSTVASRKTHALKILTRRGLSAHRRVVVGSGH